VLAYAINNRESFDNASRWLVEAHRYLEDDFPPVAVIANKSDLRETFPAEDLVSTEEGEQFTQLFIDKLGVQAFYRETSALNGQNVMEVFTSLTAMMIRDYENAV
jgi:GTPase SAR1 family protein